LKKREATNMVIIEKAVEILTNHILCDHCLGRQFALLGTNFTNEERGKSIKTFITLQEFEKFQKTKNENSINLLKIIAKNGLFQPAVSSLKSIGVSMPEESNNCFLCNNKFQKLPLYAKICVEKLSTIEFESFLTGSIVPDAHIEKEDRLRSEFSIEHGEAFKAELNREVGKLISIEYPKKEVSFDNANVVVLIDVLNDKAILNINPIFIYGRYKKLIRGIPQTIWTCNNCMGKGCEECNNVGKRYPTSVSELIADEVLKISEGNHFKFHGSGREDIDALMLGNGRPFVLQIQNPLQRKFDLESLQKTINDYAEGKVEVSGLRYSNKDEVRKIKAIAPFSKKTYRALVETENEIIEDQLKDLEEKLNNVVLKQETPQRVIHRRADKVRTKTVHEVKTRQLEDKKFEFIVLADGGTYIKELISGDEGRTIPSVSSILNTKATCVELDVLKVEHEI